MKTVLVVSAASSVSWSVYRVRCIRSLLLMFPPLWGPRVPAGPPEVVDAVRTVLRQTARPGRSPAAGPSLSTDQESP